MKINFLLILFLFSSNLYADDFQSKAQKALMPFKKALMGKLKTGIKSGAVNAVNMCNLEAPKITKKHSEKEYIIGRVSNKNRNLKNAPEKWMQAVLKEYDSSNAKNKLAPRVIKVTDNKRAYVEPIYMKGMCLNCHGSKLHTDVQEVINKKYPQDKATGYKAGEFRGLFWVLEK